MSWKWSEWCQQSFKKLKEVLTFTTVLTHYDPKVIIALACDASSTRIGPAVLYHVYQDGAKNELHMAQKQCQSAECNYSQIKIEALNLSLGDKKSLFFMENIFYL